MAAIDREFQSAPAPSYQPPTPPVPMAAPKARRSRKPLVIGAIVAVVALLAGGIVFGLGLGDSKPSKAAFIADADEICRPANGPVAAIAKPTSYPELATASGTVVTTTTNQLGQLRKLDQPGGDDGALVTAIFVSLDGTVTAAKALQDAAGRTDDVATISATNAGRAAFSEAMAKASSFGFGSCATGLQSGMDAVFGGSQAVIKAGYVAKAEASCRAAVREVDEIDEPTGPDEVSTYFAQIADLFDKITTEIKALPVPPGDEATVADMISSVEKVNDKGRDYFDAIDDEDEARVLATEKELNTLQTAADAKLDAYGLGTCGSNFGGE